MDYWEIRASYRQAAVDRTAADLMRRVHRVFERTEAQAGWESVNMLNNFMKAFKLDRQTAKDILNNPLDEMERRELLKAVQQMPKCRLRSKYLAQLSSEAYRYRISRNEALRMNVQAIYMDAAQQTVDMTYPAMLDMMEDTRLMCHYDIQHRVGFGYQVDTKSTAAANMALREKWMGTSYSQRIWKNAEQLGDDVADVMLQFATTGSVNMLGFETVANNRYALGSTSMKELNDMAARLIDANGFEEGMRLFYEKTGLDEKGFNAIRAKTRYAADRLITTEANYLAGQANLEAYEEAGIAKYKYSAILDSHTCGRKGAGESCSALDGMVFALKDAKVGVNMHPMHPWCRCTETPYIDGISTDGMKRASMDKDGNYELVPESMKHTDWKAWQEAGRPVSAKDWMNGKR